ncbi:MAG: hypothetical protein IJH75_04605 [Mogibacterium sp.]|nr:hypothetical protein [Mogibacterium sp.]
MSKGRSKKVNLLMAFIAAFATWIYVVYSVDPATTKTFHDVPIEFLHESSLTDDELALSSVSTESIEVTVRAKRSVLVNLKEEDFTVTVDLNDAGKGENTLNLMVSVPNNVSVQNQSESRVVVDVEDEIRAEKPARVEYSDPSDPTKEPYVTEQNIDTFTVLGAETLVNEVAYVRIPVTNEKVTDAEKTFSVTPIAVDNEGNEVPFVRIRPDKASASVYNAVVKEVDLRLSVNNPDDEEYTRSCNAPETIRIKGTEEALLNVNSITTDLIDISTISESQDIVLTYDLPEGVQVANASADKTMFVKVTPYVAKELTFPASGIEISGLDSSLNCAIQTESVTIRAIGTTDQLEALTAEDFAVSVDASGLDAGSYTLQAEVSTEAKLYKAALEDSIVYVVITAK